MRTISDFGIDLTVRREGGFRLRTYRDQLGKETIALGHLLRPGESYPNGITMAQAREIFRRDMNNVVDAIDRLITYPLTQRQFDCTCALVFNIGVGALERSHLRVRLNADDVGTATRDKDGKLVYTGAMKEWAEYVHGVDKDTKQKIVVPELVSRRAEEIAIFLSDVRRDVNPATAPDMRDATLSEMSFGRDDDEPKGAA